MSAREEPVRAVKVRSGGAEQGEKRDVLDELVAVTGYHWKHALRVLNARKQPPKAPSSRALRVYDVAVQATLIILWEVADRICGKRLKAALSTLVGTMEWHGHLSLDEQVGSRVLEVSAVTVDRLLRPIREAPGRWERRRSDPSTYRFTPSGTGGRPCRDTSRWISSPTAVA